MSARTLAFRPALVARRVRAALLGLAAAGSANAQLTGTANPQLPPSQTVTPPSQLDPQGAEDATRREELTVLYGIRSGVTLSDNLTLSSDKKAGMAFEVSPYLLVRANTERLKANVSWQLRNVYRTAGDSLTLGRSALTGDVRSAVYEDTVWVDFGGRIANINSSPQGPLSFDPVVSGVNLTEVRSFYVSPYVRNEIPGYADYELRYRYATSNFGGFLGRTQHTVSGFATTGARLGRWSASTAGDLTRIELGNGRNFERQSAVTTLSYLLTPELRVGATLNFDRIEGLRNDKGETSGYGPGVLVDWRPNSRVEVSAAAARRYYGNTTVARASYRLRRVGLSVSHSRAVLSSVDGSILFFDPTSLGNTSGTPFFNPLTNPLTNRLLQQQLLLFGASPLDLALLSNALVQDRRTTATAGLYGIHNAVTLTAFYNERRSVGEQSGSLETVGGPRGGTVSDLNNTFNGLLTQRGFQAGYAHRLDQRSTFNVFARRSQIEVDGLIAGLLAPGRSTLSQLVLSVSTRLTADTLVSVLVRRTIQDRAGTGGDYNENAIVGSVDVRF